LKTNSLFAVSVADVFQTDVIICSITSWEWSDTCNILHGNCV